MIKIIGSKNRQRTGGNPLSERCWRLEEIGSSFCFSSDVCEELFLEHDELAAVGPAYENKMPWNLLNVLDSLEKLLPGFSRIIISENISLIRKRQAHSPALILEIDGKKADILKEPTLETINFLDFYELKLKPISGGKYAKPITVKNEKVSSSDLRSAGNRSA